MNPAVFFLIPAAVFLLWLLHEGLDGISGFRAENSRADD